METTWSPCLYHLHNTAGVILLKWKFFAKNPQWSWIIFKKIDPDDLASPYLYGLNLSVILRSSDGRLLSKSTLLPLPQGLWYAIPHRPPPVDSVFHFLPTCLTFYSTFKTQLQDSPLISGLPQHPLYYRPDSSWSHLCPFSMAAFHLHVFLLQQTVRSLREATHVALTSTLPPTSEFAIWMDPTFWKAANFPSSLKTFLHGLCGAAYKSENVCQDGSKNRRSHALSIWRGQLKSPPTNF